MSEMVNFDKDFVERTLNLLKDNYYKEENEVTLLLNCLLGLVTLPIERKKDEYNLNTDEFQHDCVVKMKELIENLEFYS